MGGSVLKRTGKPGSVEDYIMVDYPSNAWETVTLFHCQMIFHPLRGSSLTMGCYMTPY